MMICHTTVTIKRRVKLNDELIAILLGGVAAMPDCLSCYVVAKDPADANAIWITELWDSEQSHRASLSLLAIREAITRGKPLTRIERRPALGESAHLAMRRRDVPPHHPIEAF